MKTISALPLALVVACAAPVPTAGPAPPIPFDTFFAPAEVDAPLLSPDGTRLLWLGPVDGVRNFLVAPVDDLDAAWPLTRKTGRGVQVIPRQSTPCDAG